MKLVSGLTKLLYGPICRLYARSILGDKPADALFQCMCSLQFRKVHRYWPNLVHPQRLSEKLWARMLLDRNPQLTLLNDKLYMREYVASKVGSDCLIPLLWSGEDPEQIPFDQLPSEYVIKTNHGCGYIVFVKDAKQLDRATTKRQLKKWLRENFCQDKFLGIEWGYKNIKPTIIIESFIEEAGKVPTDYKFYCFHGRVEVLTLHFDRYIEHKTRSFDRNFNPHEFRYNFEQWTGNCHRPINFDAMVQLVEILAEDFDFMRVDLYCVGNNIYFGELTPYPGGVSTKFLPVRQDYILGEKWKMQ